MHKILIYTDGGSRGNPGPSALGVYIEDENHKELVSIGKAIGITTNNVAEYSAILEAFLWLGQNPKLLQDDTKIYFYMDSLLAYSQIVGLYKVKNNRLREILFKIREQEAFLKKEIYYAHIPREENKKADRMVNLALDNML